MTLLKSQIIASSILAISLSYFSETTLICINNMYQLYLLLLSYNAISLV